MPSDANSSFAFHDVIASTLPPVSLSQIFWPIFLATTADRTSWGTAGSLTGALADSLGPWRVASAPGFGAGDCGFCASSDGASNSGFDVFASDDGTPVLDGDGRASGSRAAVSGSGFFGLDGGVTLPGPCCFSSSTRCAAAGTASSAEAVCVPMPAITHGSSNAAQTKARQ